MVRPVPDELARAPPRVVWVTSEPGPPTAPTTVPAAGTLTHDGAEVDPAMVRAARLHYEHGMTHQEVADELGLSRVKITRLLGEARRIGVVTITVHGDARPYAPLEERLTEHLGAAGLRQVHIAPTVGRDRLSAAVAREAATALALLLPRVDSVAIGVSSTVAESVALLPQIDAPHLLVAPACGGWAGTGRTLNPDTLAFRVATRVGGQACSMPAPLVSQSADLAHGLRMSPGVEGVLRLAREADVLVVGVGVAPGGPGWDDALLSQALTGADRARLEAAGAAGDISGRFFDGAGRAIAGGLDDRVVGLTLEEMRAVPARVALACGPHKVAPLRAAIVGGLVSVLVTDRATAQALLEA